MARSLILLLLVFMSASPYATTGKAAEEPLLSRELLFGPEARLSPRLSPDGRRLAYLAPSRDGVMNIWLSRSVADLSRARMLTRDAHRGIYGYRWAQDNVHILFWQDNDGDENWHLHALDTRTGESRDLTPFAGARIQNLLLDPGHPRKVLVGINKRSHALFDMYRVDLDDGSVVLDTVNPGDVLSWTADHHFVIRAATAFLPRSGDTVLRVRAGKDAPWRDLMRWHFEDSVFDGQINGGSVTPGFTRDGRALYAISAKGGDKSRLIEIDLANGKSNTVAADRCDVAEDEDYPGVPDDERALVMESPATGGLDAIAYECGERTWQALRPEVRADLRLLQGSMGGFPYIVSRDNADAKWIVAAWAGDRPIEYSLYERASQTLEPLFSQYPALAKQHLARPEFFTIAARDGLRIPLYLTRPPGSGAHPLVLYPHGGPWDRDHDDYDPVVQLLVNRGYAVLQPQYRGSTGYGRSFFNAGNHEYGLKMRDDLIDAVGWAIRRGFADPARIGVLGFSAGGYLALRVTEARPDLFRATVDVMGPTDIKSLLETIPANWDAVKARWVRRIGDAEHHESLNRKLSPAFAGPPPCGSFFIAQGANDVRVNRQSSDSIAALLRARGASVTYAIYLDEGHGFVRPANNLDFYGRLEEFLAKALGGGAQPWKAEPGARVRIQ